MRRGRLTACPGNYIVNFVKLAAVDCETVTIMYIISVCLHDHAPSGILPFTCTASGLVTNYIKSSSLCCKFNKNKEDALCRCINYIA